MNTTEPIKTASAQSDSTAWLEGWISVDARLPELDSGLLLCAYIPSFTGIGLCLGLYYHSMVGGESHWCDEYVDRTRDKITHWMPLPRKPPNVELRGSPNTKP